jgi:hypothetical protein
MKKKPEENKKNANLPGYPEYPDNEDIFKKGKEEENIDPEELTNAKKAVKRKKKDTEEINPGGDLDVPGSELDDEDEKIGSEDEENNYYSLGGDDHEDLDEDKGDL